MEGVNHIHVIEVSRGGLVGDVHGMAQGEVPHGERLELGIAGLHAPLVLVVELAEAYSHLAAARARCRDDDQRTARLYIVILAKALITVDEVHVVGVTLDGVVVVSLDAHALQTVAVGIGRTLSVVVGDDHGPYQEPSAHELRAQAQHVLVVGDAQVLAYLVALDVHGRDDDDDLGAVAQLLEHAQLAVGLESGQHAAGMVVVKELAAEFEVEFALELGYALLDVVALYLDVFIVVESDSHNSLE